MFLALSIPGEGDTAACCLTGIINWVLLTKQEERDSSIKIAIRSSASRLIKFSQTNTFRRRLTFLESFSVVEAETMFWAPLITRSVNRSVDSRSEILFLAASSLLTACCSRYRRRRAWISSSSLLFLLLLLFWNDDEGEEEDVCGLFD